MQEITIEVKLRARNPLQKLALKRAIEHISETVEPEAIIELGENIDKIINSKGSFLDKIQYIRNLVGQ